MPSSSTPAQQRAEGGMLRAAQVPEPSATAVSGKQPQLADAGSVPAAAQTASAVLPGGHQQAELAAQPAADDADKLPVARQAACIAEYVGPELLASERKSASLRHELSSACAASGQPHHALDAAGTSTTAPDADAVSASHLSAAVSAQSVLQTGLDERTVVALRQALAAKLQAGAERAAKQAAAEEAQTAAASAQAAAEAAALAAAADLLAGEDAAQQAQARAQARKARQRERKQVRSPSLACWRA